MFNAEICENLMKMPHNFAGELDPAAAYLAAKCCSNSYILRHGVRNLYFSEIVEFAAAEYCNNPCTDISNEQEFQGKGRKLNTETTNHVRLFGSSLHLPDRVDWHVRTGIPWLLDKSAQGWYLGTGDRLL